ncbi:MULTISPECIES: hypothetical protein [Stutzerimonas stutzeri subgroup]|jgi:hypothetical protein|uniref:Uncharacterized protein n=1 Tax=Stutzerimonas stutzeri NF13 TaxID=1212548 RepID=M2TXQ9_STUST|nr:MULTISPECIES: hypothetical protein [Stutzerimonas stutzeri subgroup]EME02176.1 hypothetical protein B381_00373 [Stutzerimonas stutzeri NF13]MBK3882584.1 hypothetical protein [Stutzerimonas stutzeri]MCQ4292649.1 hypothetical protein [Stutzerimonas stutzeri]WOF76969.1 hypothetical protein P5704_012885 [Pseudomonas sp. FeN3W]
MMRIWLWPVLIGVLSTLGLIAGLVSEGAGDWLSWLALAAPVAIGLHGLSRSGARPSTRGDDLSPAGSRRAGRS